MTKIFIIISIFLTLSSFAQKNDSELLNADREFAATSYKMGVAKAFNEFLADDAVFLSSTPLPIEGKTNFMKLFANSNAPVIWQPTGSFKDKSGTSGYTYGLSKWIYSTADSLTSYYYVYNTNWIKDSTNKWKVTTDIGTEISLKSFGLVDNRKFAYSKDGKINIGKTIKEKGYKITYFSFESARKGIVPAIIVLPTNKNIKVVVCYQHGFGEDYNKEMFLEEAKVLAENGIASVMMDAPFKRKGESFIKSGGIKDAELFENNCVEWLQAINALPRWNISSPDIFFVGQSYGARIAAFMPYLDKRFKKIIILNGIYNYAEWLQTTLVDQIVELRNAISPQDFKTYVNSIAAYDASNFLKKKNDIEFYFQAATKDQTLSEYDILSCYEMTNSKKKIQWYDGGHQLNDQSVKDRVQQLLKWANQDSGR